jgi:DNA-binding response OmpR family regulator
MDGLEAIRRLRQRPEFQELPIVAVSAGASRADAAQSLAAGANVVLAKPIDLSGLLSQIASLLNVEWNDVPGDTVSTEMGNAAAFNTALFNETLTAPPLQEIEGLLHLARLRDMRAIVQHATRLA